jgi:hypothetical protein
LQEALSMDLQHYRQREQSERLLAAQALNESDRTAHLELADSYRSVIEAYERLEALRPRPRVVA